MKPAGQQSPIFEPIARYVRDGEGRAQADFIDANDPAALLEASEEAEQVPASREEVLDMLLAYLFGADPHPAHVLRRLWLALGELAPELCAGIAAHETALLIDAGEIGHAWRVKMLVRGTRYAARLPSKHDKVVRGVLRSAFSRKQSLELAGDVPLDTLVRLQAGEGVVQFGIRQAATVALLKFFYVASASPGSAGLPRPEAVLRMVYLVAKSLAPALILHMSLQNLGDMFGQERATWSYHGKHKLAAFLAARGARGYLAPHQKSEEACQSYAKSQRGNRNRLGLQRRRCA